MRLNINGVHFHVEEDGKGPALVALHGFTGSAKTWEPFLERWTRHHRVIRVDLIGHGKTDAPLDTTRYTMDWAVRDLRRILDVFSLGQAAVLGYSLGGRLALSFAIAHSERVSRLILESASPGLATEAERVDRQRRDNQLADRIEQIGTAAFVNEWEKIPLFATQSDRLGDSTRQTLRDQRLCHTPTGLANSLRGMGTGAQPSWWDHLPRLITPVLAIVGEDDEKFHRIGDQMVHRLPAGRLQVVSGAGHATHLEQPIAFHGTVESFLDDGGQENGNRVDR